MLWFYLKYGMAAANIMLLIAFILAPRKNIYHKIFALCGVSLTVIIGLYLIISVNIIHSGDVNKAGLFLEDSNQLIFMLIHRIIASMVFILMLYMAISGLRKKVKFHRKLGKVLIISYTLIYISGILLFKGIS